MLRSISLRLAAWYALAATVTLAGLFVVGYQLLERYLIRGLDQLDAAEYAQIRAQLGPHYQRLTPAQINQRIRATTQYGQVLFYIDVHVPGRGVVFYSENLGGRPLPDVPHRRRYTGALPGIGPLRIAEFVLPPFDVAVGTSVAQVYRDMDGYVEVCASLLGAMLGVSTLIGFALSRMALRPVRLIRETARRIGSDNLGERIPVAAVRDEISELARLLNQMFDRLEDAFNQIRRFAAEASHELKTPLSLIRLQAEKLLVTGRLAADQEEAVQMQLEELARLSRIIEEMLFLSRAEARAITLHMELQEPASFLAQFAQDARVLAEHHGLCFELECHGEGLVSFEPHRIRQVLLNLLVNAVRAAPHGSAIAVRSLVAHGRWRVSMENQGPYIAERDRMRIFERFVRLGDHGSDDRGSGLGLAICRSILELHHGRIWADAAGAAGGLTVTFEIPLQESGRKGVG